MIDYWNMIVRPLGLDIAPQGWEYEGKILLSTRGGLYALSHQSSEAEIMISVAGTDAILSPNLHWYVQLSDRQETQYPMYREYRKLMAHNLKDESLSRSFEFERVRIPRWIDNDSLVLKEYIASDRTYIPRTVNLANGEIGTWQGNKNWLDKHPSIKHVISPNFRYGFFVPYVPERPSSFYYEKFSYEVVDLYEDKQVCKFSTLVSELGEWRFDSQQIAVDASEDEENFIAIVDLQGTIVEKIMPFFYHIHFAGYKNKAAWSPDGRYLSMMVASQLYIADFQRHEVYDTSLVVSSERMKWSADGSQLAVMNANTIFVLDIPTWNLYNVWEQDNGDRCLLIGWTTF